MAATPIDTAASAASNVTYAGAGVAAVGGLTHNDILAIAGITVAVAGFAVNWFYKYREDKRRQREHELRLQTIAQGDE